MPNLVEGQDARSYEIRLLFQLSAFSGDTVTARLFDDPAGFCDIKMSFQKCKPVFEVYNFCFLLIDNYAIFRVYRPEFFETFLEVCNAMVQQIGVVHISAIATDPEHFLRVMVRAIWKHYGVNLARFTSQPEAFIAEGRNKAHSQSYDAWIREDLPVYLKKWLMRHIPEVVREVNQKYAAFASVFPEMPPQVSRQSVGRELGAFSLLARPVVINQGAGESGVYDVGAK